MDSKETLQRVSSDERHGMVVIQSNGEFNERTA